MNKDDIIKQIKSLYIIAVVNTGIWAISLIAFVILFQGYGNLKGMYVILAAGTAVGIQLIAFISKLK